MTLFMTPPKIIKPVPSWPVWSIVPLQYNEKSFFLMSPVPDHLISCIATISSCVLSSSSASSYILPGLSSILTFQVPIHNLLVIFLCTCFHLHPFNRPIPFLHWEFLACKCFLWTGSWPFAQPPTWRTRWFFQGFLPLVFTDSSVNRKAAVLVLVCPGYFISPVPSISGEHSPVSHPGRHQMGDQ